jgi:hypothetical protein
MANLKNLKPFKKGQCGNPKGRPKKIIPDLKELVVEVLGEKDGKIQLLVILEGLREDAVRKDKRAAQILINLYKELTQNGKVEVSEKKLPEWLEARNDEI